MGCTKVTVPMGLSPKVLGQHGPGGAKKGAKKILSKSSSDTFGGSHGHGMHTYMYN